MYKNKTVINIAKAAAILLLLASFAGAETQSNYNGENNSDKDKHDSMTKMMLQINGAGKAQLGGTIAAIQGSTLTVNSWGGVWTINISADTKLVRRFQGISSISEFAAGDYIVVMGVVNQGASWTIDAKMIRNMSIQARNANFTGTISNLSGNSFSLETRERGSVKVTLNPNAKIGVNGKIASVSDLANGMMAKINGIWDRTQSSVLANQVNARTPRINTESHEYEKEKNKHASSTNEH